MQKTKNSSQELSVSLSASGVSFQQEFLDVAFEMIVITSMDGAIARSNRRFGNEFLPENNSVKFSLREIFHDAGEFEDMLEDLGQLIKIKSKPLKLKARKENLTSVLLNAAVFSDHLNNLWIVWVFKGESHHENDNPVVMELRSELEKINYQMEKFLYSTSHDLRSPLTSIMGLSNLLKLEIAQGQAREYVLMIEECAAKLDGLIKDVLLYSKAKYKKSDSVEIDLEKLIWKVIYSFSEDPSFRSFKFEVNLDQKIPFYSDFERVELVLRNIVSNSIRYADEHKKIAHLRIEISGNEFGYQFHLLDNGIGIPKQFLSNVFGMFYKISDKSKGPGMGLFYVKQCIEQLKGTISIESELGFGTSLKLTIPNGPKGWLRAHRKAIESGF